MPWFEEEVRSAVQKASTGGEATALYTQTKLPVLKKEREKGKERTGQEKKRKEKGGKGDEKRREKRKQKKREGKRKEKKKIIPRPLLPMVLMLKETCCGLNDSVSSFGIFQSFL